MAYLKPQSPIKKGDDYVYPLTTYDQIMMPDNSRWNGATIAFHTLSFPASGWVQGEDRAYTQQVSVDGMTADRNGHVDIDMSEATVDTATSIQDAWAMIGRAQSVDGGLLLTAFNGAPSIDITVKLEVIT